MKFVDDKVFLENKGDHELLFGLEEALTFDFELEDGFQCMFVNLGISPVNSELLVINIFGMFQGEFINRRLHGSAMSDIVYNYYLQNIISTYVKGKYAS